MYISSLYLLVILASLVIGFGATAYVKHQLKKYSCVSSSTGMSGSAMAQRMLAAHGVGGVAIHRGGPDQDHFDPRNNSITLNPEVYGDASITAIATACHEAGHAIQFAEAYKPMQLRSALVPVVNFVSNAWIFVLFAGVFLGLAGFTTLAIMMYAVAVAFQLVTLPVEFNASRRALAYLGSLGLPQEEQRAAWSVLKACALTYVAAALTSILQLVYLLALRQRD